MNKEFAAHMLNEAGKAKSTEIAQAFDALLTRLQEIDTAPDNIAGRERALCRTKLEEACFFAKKAMASNPANGDPA